MEGFAVCPAGADHYCVFDFASASWPVRPLLALSSVKLLNTLFTVSHNIASDQRMYSPGREERQWADAHAIHSYHESYHPEASDFTDWWNGLLMAQLQCQLEDNTFKFGCCLSGGCVPGPRIWCCFSHSWSTEVEYQKRESEKGICHEHI